MRYRFLTSISILLAACAESTPQPAYPPFEGREDLTWIAYEVTLPGRPPNDILPSFEASARALGCHTEPVGEKHQQTIGGQLHERHGVTAHCADGTLALVTLTQDRVRIGCTRPMTHDQCDQLLGKISEAR